VNAPDPLGSALAPRWRERSFLQSLGPEFGTELAPRPVADPHWIARSDRLAAELGLADWLERPEALDTWPACAWLRARVPSPRSTPATSSASGPASSATAARCC
jgi:serine/tyrosine/threonine adenylyltransferase